jgi:hypothetical protein
MPEARKCPNCNKPLLWNYIKKRWECPQLRLGKGGIPEKYGCGYIIITDGQRKL